MYFGGIPKMTTLKKLLQNMRSVMQTRSFRQILMLCLMLIGLLVVYFIYVRKYNVNKREGVVNDTPETEEEMNGEVDKYLELLNACTNLDPNSDEYTSRRVQQEKLAEEIKAGFEQKIEKIKRLKDDKEDLQGANESITNQLAGSESAYDGLKEEYARIKSKLDSKEKKYLDKKAEYKDKLNTLSNLAGNIKAANSSEQLNPEDTVSA